MWLLVDTETQIMTQMTVPVEGEGIKIPTIAKIGVAETRMIVEIGTTEIRMITMGRITDVGETIAMIVMIVMSEITAGRTTAMSEIVKTEMVDATAEEITEMTPMNRLTAPTEGTEVEVHPAGLTPAVEEVTKTDLEMTRTMIEGHPAVPIEAVETTEETHLLAVLIRPAMMMKTQTPTPRAPTPGIIVAAVGEVEVPMSG